MSATPRLEVRGLSKTFAGVKALSDAHLVIEPGEVHALVGQNGSGKSTLIKLISGVHRADPGGEVFVDGRRIGTPVNPGRLHDEGLAFVHQDLGLVNELSVRENVRVGRHATRGFTQWIDTARDTKAVREAFDFLGMAIDPAAKVSTLKPSERVAVAVARALQDRTAGTGVVVFDESSRAIPHESLEDFYAMVRLLAQSGTAVLIVSHDLTEVLRVSDHVTALRNGTVVQMGVPTSELDEAALTRLVLGRNGELDNYASSMPANRPGGGVELRKLRGGRIRDVSARVDRGEVLGFTGTVDSGLSSLAPLIGGALRGDGQTIIDGHSLDVGAVSPAKALRAGIAYIPADRHGEGLATELTVEENITIPHLAARGRPWFSGTRWQRAETRAVLAGFDVRPNDPGAVIATLSGGNQQKVLMGKWLLGGPHLLVLDDPTQAVDVGARGAVLRATRQAAVDGTAVILCSSEPDDLVSVCDRVLVLDEGRVARELVRPFTTDEILAAVYGATPGDHS